MIHPDDAHCYPVCESCRVADVCVKGPIAPPPPSPSATWAPNQLPPERMKCGCYGPPWPIIKEFGSNILKVICDIHGETTLAKKPANRKRSAKVQIPGQGEFIDLPPF
jgi:hypothetical protein